MVGFYVWHRVIGTSESVIWSSEYYKPQWQAFFDLFNSVPLIATATLIAWKLQKPLLVALFVSMLLHAVGDFPLHAEDAHRHFFPLSDWRFISPISYWDPTRFGNWISVIEAIVTVATATFMMVKIPSCRKLAAVLLLIYLAYQVYVFMVWR